MKRLFSILLGVCFALTLCAQDHLKFMGIPIDGTPQSFVDQMKAKGFKESPYDLSKYGKILLNGKFTNKDVELCIFFNKNTISNVLVLYKRETNWEDIYDHYIHLKNLYKKKYGNPVLENDNVESAYKGIEMTALNNEDFYITSLFGTPLGTIQLSITPNDINAAKIVITYKDIANSKQVESNDLDDI